MKRTLSLFLALVICASCCICAFADAGGPEHFDYDVKVINPDGAMLYDSEYDDILQKSYVVEKYIVIPSGSVLTVTHEVDYDGVEYLSVQYNDDWGYVKLSDVSTAADAVSPSEGVKLSKPIKVKVFCGDMKLYSGPGTIYTEITTVPEGTELSYEYASTGSAYEWAYFTYKGKSGWAYCSVALGMNNRDYCCAEVVGNSSGYYTYTGKIMIRNGSAQLTKTPNDDTAVVTVPEGTELNYKYYVPNELGMSVYCEYKGKKGWISTGTYYPDNAFVQIEAVLFVTNSAGMPLYSDSECTINTGVTVPVNTVLQADYYHSGHEGGWARVKYNEEYYWAALESYESSYIENGKLVSSMPKIKLENSKELYSEPSTQSTLLKTLTKADDSYEIYADYNSYTTGGLLWHYVYANGLRGWIYTDDNESLATDYNNTISPFFADPQFEELALKAQKEAEETTQENIDVEIEEFSDGDEARWHSKDKKQPDKTINLLLIIIAVTVIVICSIVIIVLINKKKKQ